MLPVNLLKASRARLLFGKPNKKISVSGNGSGNFR